MFQKTDCIYTNFFENFFILKNRYVLNLLLTSLILLGQVQEYKQLSAKQQTSYGM